MNKRIEELAKEAGFYADKYGHCLSHLGDAPSDADDIVDLEEFAKLIVQECLELVAGFYYYDDRTCHYARPRIRQHFGIEQ